MKTARFSMMLIATLASIMVIAQTSSKEKQTAKETDTYQWVCPMHADMVSDKAGACKKCGMDLVKVKKPQIKYVCPMHPDITSTKPGKCSKCGMDLVEEKPKDTDHKH